MVADSKHLPFKPEAAQVIVDPHQATHVLPTQYGSIRERLSQFAQEALALTNLPTVSRPVYFEALDHQDMKASFQQALQSRARILNENGRIVFSVAAARPNQQPENEYWATHHQQGEVVLSEKELVEVTNKSGGWYEPYFGCENGKVVSDDGFGFFGGCKLCGKKRKGHVRIW